MKKLKGLESFVPGKHCLKMVKGGFGLKDSPRMWRVRLHAVLISPKIGLKACQADQSIYCKHVKDADGSWRLVFILSTHVDDLKGGGEEEEVRTLVEVLTAEFGKGKEQWCNFEHCGVMHEQDEKDFSIVTKMDHDVDQLKPIVSTELRTKSSEDMCSTVLIALYGTLLGGLHLANPG